MAKNRLEEAFRSEPNPPPKSGGGTGVPEELSKALAEAVPGNYFAAEMERVRWNVIHQYEQEGRLPEAWDHPFFQAMEPENLHNGYLLAHPPAAMEHLTSLMLVSHYREIMERIFEDPEEVQRGCLQSTAAEIYAFLVDGLEGGLGESIPQTTCMGIYRCLEAMYGERDAYLYYRLQLSGYYREIENEGRTFRDNPLYTLKQSVPVARKCMKFISEQFNPGDFSDEQRRAMDNMLEMIGSTMLNVRKAANSNSADGLQSLKEQAVGMSELLAQKDQWQDWLVP